MADDSPYTDVRLTEDGLSLPELKWRELVFVGALRREADSWVRDPVRPLPPFEISDLFPEGVRFEIVETAGGRVRLRRGGARPPREASPRG